MPPSSLPISPTTPAHHDHQIEIQEAPRPLSLLPPSPSQAMPTTSLNPSCFGPAQDLPNLLLSEAPRRTDELLCVSFFGSNQYLGRNLAGAPPSPRCREGAKEAVLEPGARPPPPPHDPPRQQHLGELLFPLDMVPLSLPRRRAVALRRTPCALPPPPAVSVRAGASVLRVFPDAGGLLREIPKHQKRNPSFPRQNAYPYARNRPP